jgi:glycosyltransferase involved in cell wall biosynthesis
MSKLDHAAASPEIVHVSPAMFGTGGVWGGGERFALELARAHAEQRATRLVVFGRRTRRLRLGALSIHVLGGRTRRDGRLANPRPELLVGELARAKAVHVHQMESKLTELTALLGLGLRRNVFVTDHGAAGSTVLPRSLRSRLIRGHLAVSRFAASGYPELLDRTSVIYAGVDPAAFAPHSGPRERLVVFVGRLMPHKGVDVLIEALPPSSRLEVYGRPYDARYAADLQELARGKNVHFVTAASDAEIVRAYQRARVSVLPSVDRTMYGGSVAKTELFGLTLVEAMACGTPVICTTAGAMSEVVIDGETGYVVPPSETVSLRHRLEALLSDDLLWRQMSAAAAAHVRRRFTWSHVAERSLAAYGLEVGATTRNLRVP